MGGYRGRFLWYELSTTEPEAAKAFYTGVIGWGTTVFEGEPGPYTMWTVGERPVGGLMLLPEQARAQGAPPHWLAYLGTPDVDADAARVGKLGGTVRFGPIDIPTVGRFAVVADPQGAVLALFTPFSEAGPEAATGVGTFSWNELATSDPDAAWAFYETLLGWQKAEAIDMGDAGVYQIYGCGGKTLGGIYRCPAAMKAPPHWLHYVLVADLERALARVEALGGKVLNGPMEVPGGDRIAQCLDPQGAAFALHMHSAAAG